MEKTRGNIQLFFEGCLVANPINEATNREGFTIKANRGVGSRFRLTGNIGPVDDHGRFGIVITCRIEADNPSLDFERFRPRAMDLNEPIVPGVGLLGFGTNGIEATRKEGDGASDKQKRHSLFHIIPQGFSLNVMGKNGKTRGN
jgi:hypothetical protein